MSQGLVKCTYYAFYLNDTEYPVNSKIKARVEDRVRIHYQVEVVRTPDPDEIDENGYVHVAVQIWDWKNGEELSWKEYKIRPGWGDIDRVKLSVDKSRNIGIAIYHKNLKTGKWIQDQWVGSWYIEIIPKITLTADKTEIYEGETVNFEAKLSQGAPNATVKVCVYVNESRDGCGKVTLDKNGNGKLKFSIRFPEQDIYHVKACIDKISCSNVVTIVVKRKGKPKLEVKINADKTVVNRGERITIYYKVKNIGKGSFDGGTIYFYVDKEEKFHLPVKALAPGEYQSGRIYLVIDKVGTHEVQAYVTDNTEAWSNTLTIVVKKPSQPPSPRELLKCTDYAFYLNGVRYPVNSKIKAKVGDEIRITYRIEFVRDPNPDEIDENGYVHVAVQIWDWKNGEELKWLNYKTQKGLPLEDVVWLTVDKSRNIGIAIYHKNLKTGKWIQDQWVGC